MAARPQFFRDFTWVNKLMLVLALVTAGFIVEPKLAYRGWQRQYWGTDVCGAPTDRFVLVEGAFRTVGGEYVPLYRGNPWVRLTTDSVYSAGPSSVYYPSSDSDDEKALRLPPRNLRVAWFAWGENCFYQGEFTLPEARIDSLCAAYRQRTDTTGWYFYRQPRDYDALPEPMEPGFVLSVRFETGGRLRLDVLEAHNQTYAQPVLLAYYHAAPFRPKWQPVDWAMLRARSLPAYLDSLVARLDSTGRADLRALLANKKAR